MDENKKDKEVYIKGYNYILVYFIACVIGMLLFFIYIELFRIDDIKDNNTSKDKDEMMLTGEFVKFNVVKDLKFDNTGKDDISEGLKNVINENKSEDLMLYFPKGEYKLEPNKFNIKDIKKLYLKGEGKDSIRIKMNDKVLKFYMDKSKKDSGLKIENLNFEIKNQSNKDNTFFNVKYSDNVILKNVGLKYIEE